jgi:GxxExxY protein
MNNPIIHKDLSDRVVGLALTVFYELGPGLLEVAYVEAMCWELRHAGIPHERQRVYPLKYKGDYITSYFADIVVDGKIILELKTVKALDHNMEAQIINYLKLSKIPVGYLMNFKNASLEWRRFVCQRE